MKRKDFLKKGVIAGLSLGIFGKAAADPLKCTPTADETEGPFPTHHPAALVKQDITMGKAGTPMIINIAVYNLNNGCAALKGAIVDVWHCDHKGEYSEYGGKEEHGAGGGPGGAHMPPPGGPPPGAPPAGGHPPNDSMMTKNGMMPPPGGGSMQAADHLKEHYLRGRQTTDANGVVSFHSIYPGWYVSRAPHVHVHIYNASGKSLLVTQIAFPEDVSKSVYSQGVYAAHGQPETTNENDNVFADSVANEMAGLAGNAKDGFILTHSIYVKA